MRKPEFCSGFFFAMVAKIGTVYVRIDEIMLWKKKQNSSKKPKITQNRFAWGTTTISINFVLLFETKFS